MHIQTDLQLLLPFDAYLFININIVPLEIGNERKSEQRLNPLDNYKLQLKQVDHVCESTANRKRIYLLASKVQQRKTCMISIGCLCLSSLINTQICSFSFKNVFPLHLTIQIVTNYYYLQISFLSTFQSAASGGFPLVKAELHLREGRFRFFVTQLLVISSVAVAWKGMETRSYEIKNIKQTSLITIIFILLFRP